MPEAHGGESSACGTCYEFEFSGSSKLDEQSETQLFDTRRDDTRDVGSQRLRGKRMVVQASNTGSDVQHGQFDLMIPGGGVGIFDACSTQWRLASRGADVGLQYGGILSACKAKLTAYPPHPSCAPSSARGRYDNEACYEATKQCVRNMCDEAFAPAEFSRLRQACEWFHTWYAAANNPKIRYRKVECPRGVFEDTGGIPQPGEGVSSTIIG